MKQQMKIKGRKPIVYRHDIWFIKRTKETKKLVMKKPKCRASIIQTCQKMKLLLIVCATASFAQVSRLSLISSKNTGKKIKIPEGPKQKGSNARERDIFCSTIYELNSLVDCTFTRNHLSWTLAASFACIRIIREKGKHMKSNSKCLAIQYVYS